MRRRIVIRVCSVVIHARWFAFHREARVDMRLGGFLFLLTCLNIVTTQAYFCTSVCSSKVPSMHNTIYFHVMRALKNSSYESEPSPSTSKTLKTTSMSSSLKRSPATRLASDLNLDLVISVPAVSSSFIRF